MQTCGNNIILSQISMEFLKDITSYCIKTICLVRYFNSLAFRYCYNYYIPGEFLTFNTVFSNYLLFCNFYLTFLQLSDI